MAVVANGDISNRVAAFKGEALPNVEHIVAFDGEAFEAGIDSADLLQQREANPMDLAGAEKHPCRDGYRIANRYNVIAPALRRQL